MLDFVERLTLYPWMIMESDITMLRNSGFPDSTILHIVLGCAHFNYLNRMADGIGIRFEYQTDVPESNSRASVPEQAIMTQPVSPRIVGTRPGWIASLDSEGTRDQLRPRQNLYLLLSYNPEARDLACEWRSYQLSETSQLDATVRHQLGLYISGLNGCEYSAYWLKKDLDNLGEPKLCGELLASGELPADLPASERVLFGHARRLTREPATTNEENINQLRQSGLDDHGILQLTMLCSYFSFENRVALGLGLAIESDP